VTFIEPYAFGDLNGDGLEDAVVLLVESSGGSGSFVYMAALLNQSGNAFNIATQFLSDRARVEALAIAEGVITLEMVAHGPEDPMCCPSQQVIETWELQGGTLAQLSHEEKQAADLTGLAEITWKWESLSDASGQTQITVDHPERYLLELGTDGLYQVTADCNRAMGAYTVDGETLTLLPGPTTLAECEPGSLYDEYLSYLGAVERYTIEDGKLLLQLAADGPIMHFARQVPK
jgi:heat shock protein HslJ